MAVRIRLQRRGAHKKPFYAIVAAEQTMPRDGRFIEKLGTYDPFKRDGGKKLVVKEERIAYWLSVGALPSDRMAALIKELNIQAAPAAG